MAKIIFFDGVCNMCNGVVDFVLRHEKHPEFQFATLQSNQATLLIDAHYQKDLSTIVVFDDGKTFTQSDAVFHILRFMKAPWSWLSIVRFFPRWIRDWAYRVVSKNRYTLFGKREVCRLPSKEERARFLV